MKKIVMFLSFMAFLLTVLIISGCESPKTDLNNEEIPKINHALMPEVNDENCKGENIDKIEDKEMRSEFTKQCLMRGDFTPSSKDSF